MSSPSRKKTVLITGCNPGGIGNSLAREFYAQNYHVLATARSPSLITDLATLGIATLSLDVTSSSSISALYNEVSTLTNGTLDILVNNAGRNYTVPALDVDLAEVRSTFDVNVFGLMAMCQTFAPLLIAAKGQIVQIGSVAGVIPYVFGSAYNASKAAVRSYSDTLRLELKPFGVDVITVVTGGVKSNIARVERELPVGSVYEPVGESYQRRLKHSQEVGMPNEEYARSVVRQVVGTRRRKHIWEGNMSWVVWFASTFLPHGWVDWYIMKIFGIWKLRETIGLGKKEA